MTVMTGCLPKQEFDPTDLPPKIEYVEVPKEVFVCPAPPSITPPDLYIDQLTYKDRKDYDKISKYVVISIDQLKRYIEQLESVISNYKEISKNLETINKTKEIKTDD
jgi:hypothetical protein